MAKKPDHDLPDAPDPDQDLPRRRRPHADPDLPDALAPEQERIPLLPILIAPPIAPDGPPREWPKRPGEVGVVHFEKVDGSDNGSATYHVPVAMRDRVVLWRHQYHEQNHLNANGEMVYRLTSTSGVTGDDSDPNLEPIADPVVTPEA